MAQQQQSSSPTAQAVQAAFRWVGVPVGPDVIDTYVECIEQGTCTIKDVWAGLKVETNDYGQPVIC